MSQRETFCQEPDCPEAHVPAYIDTDGCVEPHPTEHWADGFPRLPNHHNLWYPLKVEAEPPWHSFDKDDKDTWPEDGQNVWAYSARQGVYQDSFYGGFSFSSITHWQPIETPSPPSEEV